MPATPSSNELRRLEALRRYHITDTIYDEDYDNIAKLASALCGTPVSLVTFVDENWQWFKAKTGTEIQGTPREIAFCEHTIRTPDEVMVVEDATADPRFVDNPLVTEDPNIRFYAGAPLLTEDGYALGTVCVLDVVPRKLSEQQIEALRILSTQVSTLLKSRRAAMELGLANTRLKSKNRLIHDENLRLEGALMAQSAERSLEISAKNYELERANKELEAFAYISSHDLQEPLRKIASLTSWLQEKEHGNLSEKGAEYLNKINLSAERMKALIDDLLRYSRASLATIHFEETTLERAIAPVLEDLDEEIKRSKAAIQISGEGRLFVMEFQFRLMLHNLISNAIKFSKPGTQPQIRISLTHEFGQIDGMPFFKLEISDDGIGFDNAYNERIFSLFQRLTDDLKTAGTGIGLTIVKKIVDNHNGTVSAYGKPGHGATFTIRIPDQMLL